MASVSGSGGVGLGAFRGLWVEFMRSMSWRMVWGFLASKSEALIGFMGGSFLGLIRGYFWGKFKISSSKNDEKMTKYGEYAIE
jgi:ABC-type nitrate/sulfonate/bicarbonate transport system permease component